ncbi:MAG: hypothetical protein ACIAQF_07100 [Phycisphaerales bacterium JB065]
MGLGQKLSTNIAPLLLRTALAATFIWIGTPMVRTMVLTPEQTARLANADIREPGTALTITPSDTNDSRSPDAERTPDPAPSGGGSGEVNDPGKSMVPPPMAALTQVEGDQGDDTPSAVVYTPEQFVGTEQKARRWVLVALTALDAAQPVDDGDDATPNRSVLPLAVGNGGPWVKWGSIAFALIVAIGGWALLFGIFTRTTAFGLALCTGLSLWVLELGPTWALRAGKMGFMPDPQIGNPDVSPEIWMRLMLLFVVLMTALALMIVGPGKLSFDHWIFVRGKSTKHRDAFAEDEG